MKLSFPSLVAAVALAVPASADVVVTLTGSEPEGGWVKISNPAKGVDSSTSARFKSNKAVVSGVAETDRDFGQTFRTGDEGFVLERITVKLGDQAIAPSVFGADVSIQLFEVFGEPIINDNGTTEGKVSTWSDDPRVDDFIESESYKPLAMARTGRLPAYLMPGQLMVFNFRKASRVRLRPNTQYAYVFMFDSAATDRALSFATVYWSDYDGGHAIRRDSSIPKAFNQRSISQPTTKAGTKSDVFSDAVFWVEGSDIDAEANAVLRPDSNAVVTIDSKDPDSALPLPMK